MRQTTLKRTPRGYVRNLGLEADGIRPKFYLGHDKPEAERRLAGVVALWRQVEERHRTRGRPGVPFWDADRLAAAKTLAKGLTPTLAMDDYEPPDGYFLRVNETTRSAGLDFRAADEFSYEVGRQDLLDDAAGGRGRLAVATGTPNATGRTLHQALRASQDHIRHEYRDHDGAPTDNGKTKLDQIKTIMGYVADPDLGALDYHGTDELFGVFRRLPQRPGERRAVEIAH